MMHPPSSKIVAPVASPEQAREVLAAGADELYCGAMFDEWVDLFGDFDLLTRRQGRLAHVGSGEDLAAIVAVAGPDRPVALTLNGTYSSAEQVMVLDLARLWEKLGGSAVMVRDIGLLLALRKMGSGLHVYVSLLACTFNSMSSAFFAGLGASRIVLPRELSVSEMGSLIAGGPERMEYECLVLNQKCAFIDGMCGFYHGTRLPEDVPCTFDYHEIPGEGLPVAYSLDPEYEGHGCRLSWQTPDGIVKNLAHNDFVSPHCAACFFVDLMHAGVGFFKIAGRGLDTDSIVRSVRFVRKAGEIWNAVESRDTTIQRIKDLYIREFHNPCGNRVCYYRL